MSCSEKAYRTAKRIRSQIVRLEQVCFGLSTELGISPADRTLFIACERELSKCGIALRRAAAAHTVEEDGSEDGC